jgi:hypothetical protein
LASTAGASAAFHVDDFDLEPFLLVEAAGLRHPDREDGYDRRGDADLERLEIGRHRGRREREAEQGRYHAEGVDLHCFPP